MENKREQFFFLPLKAVLMRSLKSTRSETTASLSELKNDPIGTVATGEGLPVVILDRNIPVFYCVPAKAYEALMDKLEDLELNAIADAREGQPIIKVKLDER